MSDPSEVRDFLATRRARRTPDQVGLSPLGTRRVPGLRREEVAQLAGVSVDYYVRLEKGKVANPSHQVLDAIARVLGLDEAERVHLHDIARRPEGARRRPAPSGTGGPATRPGLQWLLDAMGDVAAIVGTPALDLVAANDLGRALYAPMLDAADGAPPNFARFAFLHPASRTFYPSWEGAARVSVAQLRMAVGRAPRDRRLTEVVGELATRSDEFRLMWAQHEVRLHQAGTKTFTHPGVGPLELEYLSVPLPGEDGLGMTTYVAAPGSSAADGMRLLGRWAVERATAPADGAEVPR